MIIVEVLDNGKGIDNNNVSKVFDPFFTTKQEGEGTGLGLSVSYGIIKRHGGTINIEKVVPSGVKVSIVLPVEAKTVNTDRQSETPNNKNSTVNARDSSEVRYVE